MLVVKRKKYLLRIVEFFFADEYSPKIQNADLAIYLQAKKPFTGCKEFSTLHIDLSKSEDSIFAGIEKNARYEIKRARGKDEIHIRFQINPCVDEIEQFVGYYNRFAKSKGLPLCNIRKLRALKEAGGLAISRANDESNVHLCSHAYIIDGKRARLMYSASLFRNEIDSARRALMGRSNRFLHWHDIISFKSSGYYTYDFGGISMNKKDEGLSRIDEFKRSFGGEIVKEFNILNPQSTLGKMVLLIMK